MHTIQWGEDEDEDSRRGGNLVDQRRGGGVVEILWEVGRTSAREIFDSVLSEGIILFLFSPAPPWGDTAEFGVIQLQGCFTSPT